MRGRDDHSRARSNEEASSSEYRHVRRYDRDEVGASVDEHVEGRYQASSSTSPSRLDSRSTKGLTLESGRSHSSERSYDRSSDRSSGHQTTRPAGRIPRDDFDRTSASPHHAGAPHFEPATPSGPQAGYGDAPQGDPGSSACRADLGSAKAVSAGNALARAVRRFSRKPYSREAFVGGLLGTMFLVMAGRLVYLQAIATGTLSTAAKNERTARLTLAHRRGGIYDRNGNVLARSVDAVNIAAHPDRITEVNATANVLASVLGGDASSYAALIEGDDSYVYIATKVDPEVAEQLRAAFDSTNTERSEADLEELGGIEYEDTSKRVYPMGEVAGNVVGCVGTDGQGLTGLELQYDDVLSGTDGYLIQERGLYGAPIVGGQYERVDPVDGENIVISIDIDIQRVAQEQLTAIIEEWEAGDGCVVVMQPRTGEILACCSTPYLDPGDFSTATTEAFNLRCVSDSYEPGSTVKPITASAAIDLGVATPETSYYVPANIEVGDDTVGDSDGRDYDTTMTLTNILELSSNVGAVLVAESIGAENFAEYFEQFKIGTLTGVDYPGEALGLVSDLEDYTGAWTAMAFGQGLAVPPVQVARAISAIANEGVLVQPHFLVNRGGTDVEYEEGERAIATATADQVAEMMYSVTENGYGRTGRIEGYRLSTKTGTAERVDDTTGLYIDGKYTVSFIGFGPTDDPRVLVYVLVDYVPNATGSTAVGANWAVIMQEALDKLQIAPSS